MILKFFLLTSFILFQFGQMGRISFLNQHVNVYLYELVMGLFILFVFIKYKLIPLTNLWKSDKSFFLLFFIFLISFINKVSFYSLGENLIAFAYFVRLFIYSIFAIYTYFYLRKEPLFLKKQDTYIPIFAIGIITTSLLQYFFYPDLRNLLYLGWDPHLYRLFGVFFDASISASVYAIFIIFFLINSFQNKIVLKYKYFFVFLFLALLILTYSRDLIISLLFTVILFFIRTKKVFFIFFFIIFFVVVYNIAPKTWGEGVNLKRTFSIQSRFIDYSTGLKMWEKAPLFGIGYNRLRYDRQRLNTGILNDSSHAGASFHSSYLIILVTAGLFGLLAILFVQYSLFTKIAASGYYMILISIASLGDNIMLHPFILFLLSVLIGVTRIKQVKINRLLNKKR